MNRLILSFNQTTQHNKFMHTEAKAYVKNSNESVVKMQFSVTYHSHHKKLLIKNNNKYLI